MQIMPASKIIQLAAKFLSSAQRKVHREEARDFVKQLETNVWGVDAFLEMPQRAIYYGAYAAKKSPEIYLEFRFSIPNVDDREQHVYLRRSEMESFLKNKDENEVGQEIESIMKIDWGDADAISHALDQSESSARGHNLHLLTNAYASTYLISESHKRNFFNTLSSARNRNRSNSA